MNTKSFDVTVGGKFGLVRWWDSKYPNDPFWQIDVSKISLVHKKYGRGILKEIRGLLKSNMKDVVVFDVSVVWFNEVEVCFKISTMGDCSVDLSNFFGGLV
jgi:hypothetical protein